MVPGVVVCWSGFEPRTQTLRIPPEGLELGREHASATDERISRKHFRVRIGDGFVFVEDLGSRNGTFLDRWGIDREMRAPFPAVIRAGHTVFVVVRDIESYEDLKEPKVGAALERAREEVVDAARAEQNVMLEMGHLSSIELVRLYCDTLGGNVVIYEPDALKGSSLDASLTDTRPRVVVLRLTSCALSFADMPTVMTWLETDVRFVTVMWPGGQALSMVEPSAVARLRERVIEVANPRYDELPYRVRDIARKHAPEARVHANICEGLLLKAKQYDEEWLMPRFIKAVAEWYANPDLDHALLRMQSVVDALDPPPTGAHCLVGGVQRRRRSF